MEHKPKKINDRQKEIFVKGKTIYFVGIGGIGVSALARLALHRNCTVFGSDLVNSDMITDLKKRGASITLGKKHRSLKNINIDALIYTTAADKNHPHLQEALKHGIPIFSYPQALGEISKQYFTIAISGMHGKSTTTALLGMILESAGKDPLVIVGTKVHQWGGNIRIPRKSHHFFIVEADEYKSAMKNLSPNIVVLTRIEEDHLDYFQDIKHIISEFSDYIKRVPETGAIIANAEDSNIQKVIRSARANVIPFNTQNDEVLKQELKNALRIPGDHNIENALAAYKVGRALNIQHDEIIIGVSQFTGTWRRLEKVGSYRLPSVIGRKRIGVTTTRHIDILSDYAHHPTEIKATLKAIKQAYPKKRILLAYQPHQHNRTKKLFNNFVHAFADADILILSEIFDVAGREENEDQNISSEDIVKKILRLNLRDKNTAVYSPNLKKTKEKIIDFVELGDIIVIMGAGDIDTVARELISFAQTKQ